MKPGLRSLLFLGGATAFAVSPSLPVRAQDSPLRQSVGVAYASHRSTLHDQYLGAGIEYHYLFRDTVGLQIQASRYPQYEYVMDGVTGGPVDQLSGSALAGHRWGRYGLFAECGFGSYRTTVFAGADQRGSLVQLRVYPDLLLGGVLDIAVSQRWSLTYEVRDNLLFVPAYSQFGLGFPSDIPFRQQNYPEGRLGVAFHFRLPKKTRHR